MKKFRRAGMAATLLAAGLLTACGGGYYSAGVVVGPEPAPLVTGPMGYAPAPGYVWTDGYYDLRGNNWVWVNGRWLRPPRPHAVYVRPHWERHGRGYRFHQGRWQRH